MEADDVDSDETSERRYGYQDEDGHPDATELIVGERGEARSKSAGDRHERRDPQRAVPARACPWRLGPGHIGEDDRHDESDDDLRTRRPERRIADRVQQARRYRSRHVRNSDTSFRRHALAAHVSIPPWPSGSTSFTLPARTLPRR